MIDAKQAKQNQTAAINQLITEWQPYIRGFLSDIDQQVTLTSKEGKGSCKFDYAKNLSQLENLEKSNYDAILSEIYTEVRNLGFSIIIDFEKCVVIVAW